MKTSWLSPHPFVKLFHVFFLQIMASQTRIKECMIIEKKNHLILTCKHNMIFVNKFLFLLPSVYHKTKFAEALFCGALKSEHATATLFSRPGSRCKRKWVQISPLIEKSPKNCFHSAFIFWPLGPCWPPLEPMGTFRPPFWYLDTFFGSLP